MRVQRSGSQNVEQTPMEEQMAKLEKTIKRMVLVTSLLAAAFITPAMAAEGTLVVAGFGGSTEKLLRDKVIPDFERTHGVKVQYVAGQSTDTLAKLMAQRDNQQIDVAMIDDGPMAQAVNLGLCAPLEGINASEFHSVALLPGGKAIGYGIVAVGLMYNKKVFADQGWPAPTSWNDLKNPKFKGKLVLAPLSSSYGVLATVMLARVGGGGESNIEPGFAAMKKDVGPNVLAFEASVAKLPELFQTAGVVLAVWGSHRTQAFAATGFPVDFVYPREGAPAVMVTICPVAKAKPVPQAQAFIKLMLSAGTQKILADAEGIAPVRKGVEVATKGFMPVGERAEKLVQADWLVINSKRDEWNKRWTREIER